MPEPTHANATSEAAKTSTAARAPAQPARAAQVHDAGRARRNMVAQLKRERGSASGGRVIQRKCKCAGGAGCSECAGEVPEERKKQVDKLLQRKGEGGPAKVPDTVERDMRRSGGLPLDTATRDLMESRFQKDFSDVLLHTDSAAAEAAAGLRAQAFTTGRDIYFGAGQFDPATDEGRRLLAHELTHVAQQRSGAARAATGGIELGPPDDAFEREADRNASAVVSGAPPAPVGHASPSSVARRKGIDKDDLKDVHAGDVGKDEDKMKGTKPAKVPLTLPPDKGDVYGEYAKALKDRRLSPTFKFDRPSTSTLRSIWQEKYGGEDVFPEKLRPGGDACEVDHIIELQVGGTNNKENLQLLEKGHNASSGSTIRSNVTKAREGYGDDVIVRFTKVVPAASPVDDKTDECVKFEKTLKKKAAGQVADVLFGAREIDIDLPKPTTQGGKLYDISGRRGQIVAGLDFSTLTWSLDAKKAPEVGSQIDAQLSNRATKFLKNKKRAVVLDIAADKKVALGSDYKVLKLLFPFLSEADLNMSIDDAGAVAGQGKFTPTLPLLSRAQIVLKVEGGKFTGGAKLSADQINLPIPGVAVTECSLEVSLEEGEFSALGVLAFRVGSFVEARLEAKADAGGFVLRGTVNFFVPGLDKVEGKVTYREKKLTGDVEIGKEKFKLPGVKSANLHVHITDTEVTGEGVVLLDIPGIKKAKLAFGVDRAGNYAITGAAELDIPGVKEAEIGLAVVDGELRGYSKLALDIPGFEGAGAGLELKYEKGVLTGAGAFNFKRGKLSGQVKAALNEKRKLTGSGELAYEVAPKLTAAVLVEVLEDGSMKFGGELRFPDSIKLFDEIPFEKTLFSKSIKIPLFAIPVIDAGIVADIGGDLKARAGVGPGTLGLKLKLAPFDPTKDDQPLDFSAGAKLSIPAFAELAFSFHGGIGLSAAIADVTGGIKLITTIGLRGGLTAEATIDVQGGQIAVTGVLELKVQPSLRFDVNAYVNVEIDLWVKTWEVYHKEWNLASKEWGSNMTFGLRFPARYVFGQPFDLSVDQIEFIRPELDITQILTDLLPF